MKKLVKNIVDNRCNEVFVGTDTDWAILQGFVEQEVEKAYDGSWYLKGCAPAQTIKEQNEAIKAKREQMFSLSPCADYKYNYEEDVARYGQDSEQAKFSASVWLAEKDKIRNENPYIDDNGLIF